MDVSVPRRSALFAQEPVPELRGLASLTDPEPGGDDAVAAVIDLAVMGARGDGKTQFLVHAIRALHARAPSLVGGEAEHNRAVMRLVLDPRAPRPDATPPGVVPHFTFRARASVLFEQLGLLASLSLARQLARVGGWILLACVLAGTAIGCAVTHQTAVAAMTGGGAALVAAIAVLVARSRIARAGEIEIAFWDVAGEHVYGDGAADYHALLGRLVDARRRRAESLGRAYAFAPVLICNPLALGTLDEGSPYTRMRAVLPLFAALDRDGSRALVAVNRWSVVDRICMRGARRDEVISVVTAQGARRTRPTSRRTGSRASSCASIASTPRTGATATSRSSTCATTRRSRAASSPAPRTRRWSTSTTTAPARSAATPAGDSSTGSVRCRDGPRRGYGNGRSSTRTRPSTRPTGSRWSRLLSSRPRRTCGRGRDERSRPN